MTALHHRSGLVTSISNLLEQKAMPGCQQKPRQCQRYMTGQLAKFDAITRQYMLMAAGQEQSPMFAAFLCQFEEQYQGTLLKKLENRLLLEGHDTDGDLLHDRLAAFSHDLEMQGQKEPLAVLGPVLVMEIVTRQMLVHMENFQHTTLPDNVVLFRHTITPDRQDEAAIYRLAKMIDQLSAIRYQAVFASAIQFTAILVDLATWSAQDMNDPAEKGYRLA